MGQDAPRRAAVEVCGPCIFARGGIRPGAGAAPSGLAREGCAAHPVGERWRAVAPAEFERRADSVAEQGTDRAIENGLVHSAACGSPTGRAAAATCRCQASRQSSPSSLRKKPLRA